VRLYGECLKDDKFKYSGNIIGIYWEYNGTILGMKLIFTDDNQYRRKNYGNELGMKKLGKIFTKKINKEKEKQNPWKKRAKKQGLKMAQKYSR